jgi:hypothetical protein
MDLEEHVGLLRHQDRRAVEARIVDERHARTVRQLPARGALPSAPEPRAHPLVVGHEEVGGGERGTGEPGHDPRQRQVAPLLVQEVEVPEGELRRPAVHAQPHRQDAAGAVRLAVPRRVQKLRRREPRRRVARGGGEGLAALPSPDAPGERGGFGEHAVAARGGRVGALGVDHPRDPAADGAELGGDPAMLRRVERRGRALLPHPLAHRQLPGRHRSARPRAPPHRPEERRVGTADALGAGGLRLAPHPALRVAGDMLQRALQVVRRVAEEGQPFDVAGALHGDGGAGVKGGTQVFEGEPGEEVLRVVHQRAVVGFVVQLGGDDLHLEAHHRAARADREGAPPHLRPEVDRAVGHAPPVRHSQRAEDEGIAVLQRRRRAAKGAQEHGIRRLLP